MKELQYPFDADYILSSKKSIRRQLLGDGSSRIEKKIAVLGGSTTSIICQIIELFLLDQGIAPKFYESEYNRYYQDAVFDNPELEEFAPDIIYVFTTTRNITSFPGIKDIPETVEALIRSEMDKYLDIWANLTKRYHCPVIQNNFELPYYRVMGNKEASDIHGKVNFITRLNLEFYKNAEEHDNIHICDINYISADYGLKEWSDPFYYHMYKYAVNVNAVPYLAFNVANIIKSVFGKNKKGLVLDLDNTLWGGVIGDDGVDNIILGPEVAEGEAYIEFQRYLKENAAMGVVLNIDSKNDPENALAGLAHADSVLRESDFAVIKANWEPKDINFIQIANTLNLLPESLVFVDDNPAERYIVESSADGIIAPQIGEVYQYVTNLDRGGYFEVTALSEDDIKRNDMYRDNARREAARSEFADYGEYLKSLEMTAYIKEFEPAYMARIAQLTNKSNQFNLTTRRYTQNEIEDMSGRDDIITLYGRLTDRFGDNGVVSVVIGNCVEKECLIDLWLMSCRVLKRDMENAMMDTLVKKCLHRGITRVRGFYYPTAKNKMVKDFYKTMGFDKISEDESGSTEWVLNIDPAYADSNRYIKVEE